MRTIEKDDFWNPLMSYLLNYTYTHAVSVCVGVFVYLYTLNDVMPLADNASSLSHRVKETSLSDMRNFS